MRIWSVMLKLADMGSAGLRGYSETSCKVMTESG